MADNGVDTAAMPPPVSPDDPGIGPLMIGIMWTFTCLAMIAIALRLYVRIFIVKKLGLDDWFMMIAGVSISRGFVISA